MDSAPPRRAPATFYQRLVNEQKLAEIERANQHAEEHEKNEGTLQDRTASADFSSFQCRCMHGLALGVRREDTLIRVGDRRLVGASKTTEYCVDGISSDGDSHGNRHQVSAGAQHSN